MTQGFYRISRNHQWISLVTMFLGPCIAIGSWLAIFLLLIAVVLCHLKRQDAFYAINMDYRF
jgi:protein-S-isoprenylcysteine O-methyltransferase Ste14